MVSSPFGKLLCPPEFSDEGRTLAARKLWAVLVGLLGSTGLIFPFLLLLLPGHAPRTLGYMAAFSGLFISLLVLNRRGRTRLAAFLMVQCAMLLLCISAWTAGGVRAPGMMGLLVVVVAAGTLEGPMVAALTAAVCGVASLILLVAELKGILPPPTLRHTSTSTWMILVILMAELVVIQVVVNWVVRRAERQAIAEALERQRAETALRESEWRYRQLFEHAPIGIYRTTPDGRILETNPALLAMLGYKSKEHISTVNLEREGYAPQYSREEFRKRLEQGDVNGLESKWVGADGRILCVRENARVIRDNDGKVLYYEGTVEDFTERTQMEERLRQSGKMEAIGQLAGGVAHDFNNILAGFLLHIGLMEQEPGLPDSFRSSLREMEMQAKLAASLTRRLLVFSRQQVIQTRVIDLNEALEELGTMLRRIIGEDYALVLDHGSTPVCVNADGGMIDQMVMNLCVNARDAMAGGGTIRVSVRPVDVSREDVRLHPDGRAGRFGRLEVVDTGCGMSEGTLKRLFEPFFTTKEVGKGTGLGLATVYRVVQQHFGWVEVRSALGQGTTIAVYLPVCEGPAIPSSRGSPNAVKGGSETVLVVEDDKAVRQVMRHVLERLGYSVIEADSGPAALRSWDENSGRIDLLLTDMILPNGMTGLDLAEMLKSQHASLKVIICSGYNTELLSERSDQAMGAVYLSKPFTSAALAQAIRSCIEPPKG